MGSHILNIVEEEKSNSVAVGGTSNPMSFRFEEEKP